MHRHTTNSISTGSAVFSSPKAHFKKKSPGLKTKPQISITTDGRERGKADGCYISSNPLLFFSFEFNMFFLYTVITAYDEDKLILIGLIWDLGAAEMHSIPNVCKRKSVCVTMIVCGEKATFLLCLHEGRFHGTFCNFLVFRSIFHYLVVKHYRISDYTFSKNKRMCLG